MKTKLVCIKSFYYNATQPYFHFKEGETYEAIVYKMDKEYAENHIIGGDKYIYSFTFCDLVIGHINIKKNFITIDEWRDYQLKKLNI
jgi:hypothetical protein